MCDVKEKAVFVSLLWGHTNNFVFPEILCDLSRTYKKKPEDLGFTLKYGDKNSITIQTLQGMTLSVA